MSSGRSAPVLRVSALKLRVNMRIWVTKAEQQAGRIPPWAPFCAGQQARAYLSVVCLEARELQVSAEPGIDPSADT